MVECVSCEYLVAIYQCMATERRETFIVRIREGRVQKKTKMNRCAKRVEIITEKVAHGVRNVFSE